ncbi:MAG: hypothetical protein Q8O19_05880, partial [Rectinemataceae bacterium]|nr:hypothetical protein [Rectinemataceae bacterium]
MAGNTSDRGGAAFPWTARAAKLRSGKKPSSGLLPERKDPSIVHGQEQEPKAESQILEENRAIEEAAKAYFADPRIAGGETGKALRVGLMALAEGIGGQKFKDAAQALETGEGALNQFKDGGAPQGYYLERAVGIPAMLDNIAERFSQAKAIVQTGLESKVMTEEYKNGARM